VISASISGWASKVVVVLGSYLIVPLAIDGLGVTDYGLWIAITSLIAVMGFLDFGIPNALISEVADLNFNETNSNVLGKLISTAYICIFIISLVGLVIFFWVYEYINWGELFGIKKENIPDNLELLIKTVAIIFFINIFLGLVGKIERGAHKTWLDNIFTAIGSVLSIVFSYIAISYKSGILVFAFAFAIGPLVANLANNIFFLYSNNKIIALRLANFELNSAIKLIKYGGIFFVLQICAAIQSQADNVIISNILGPAEVAKYSIYFKLAMVAPTLFAIVLAPLWPAYADAMANNRAQWVKKTFYKSLSAAVFLGAIFCIAYIAFGKFLIKIWIGNENSNLIIESGDSLIVGCGIWIILLMAGTAISMLLNGLRIYKIQFVIAITALASNLLLTILLLPIIGISGAVYATVISYSLTVIIP
jgi:O-antigen/teichoic acid export membrane protein